MLFLGFKEPSGSYKTICTVNSKALNKSSEEFKVDASKLAQLQNAGMHPLKIAGVM